MIIKITSLDLKSFKIEAHGEVVIKPKVYANDVFGEYLSLVNSNEKSDILVDKVHYSDWEVDTITFANIVDLQTALVDVVFSSASGSGAKGWSDSVEFRADLPVTLNNPTIGEVYLVEKPTKILLGAYTTYQSGLYIRELNNGNLNDWRKLNVKVKFNDSQFAVVSAVDESKEAKLDLSLVSASTTRTLSVQDKDGTIALDEDVVFNEKTIGTNLSTGVIETDGLSINADNTKFDLGASKGWVVDNITTPETPSITFVDTPAQLAVTPTFLATDPVTFVSCDAFGVIIQRNVPPDAQQIREELFLGVVVHSNNVIINAINNLPILSTSPLSQFVDIMRMVGIFNGGGNIFGANGSTLEIVKSQGLFAGLGVNYENDPYNPHAKLLSSLTGATFRYRDQNSVEGLDTTLIDPNTYDNAGVDTAVPVNKWTVQRITVFSSNIVRVQKGQTVYNSKTLAIQGIDTDPFTVEANISNNGLFRAFLVVQEGTNDLSDLNEAQFLPAPKFQNTGGFSGGASVSNMQQTYDNSVNPEITTNDAHGSVDYRRGTTGGDTDKVLTIQNGAGTETASFDGNGDLIVNKINGRTPEELARTNFKLIRSEAELIAKFPPVGDLITLTANVEYEGTITTANRIDLNGFYLVGKNAFTDVHVYTGTAAAFVGANSGTIKILTLVANGVGAKLFDLEDTVGDKTILIRDVIPANSTEIGSIKGHDILAMIVINPVNNSNGFTYEDINQLYVKDVNWSDSNSGTFETYIGDFGIIQNTGGQYDVSAGVTGVDVSGITSLGTGEMLSSPFSGAGTFITGTVGVEWLINCKGVPLFGDQFSTGFLVFENGAFDLDLTQNVWDFFPMTGATIDTDTAHRFEQLAGFPDTLVYKGIQDVNKRIVSTFGLRRIGSGQNTYQMRIVVNGVQVGGVKQFELGGVDGSATLTTMYNFETDDEVWAEVRNITDNEDIRLLSASITIK